MPLNIRETPGVCDECGKVYALDTLRHQVRNGKRLGLRVCPKCYDRENTVDYEVSKSKVGQEKIAVSDPKPPALPAVWVAGHPIPPQVLFVRQKGAWLA